MAALFTAIFATYWAEGAAESYERDILRSARIKLELTHASIPSSLSQLAALTASDPQAAALVHDLPRTAEALDQLEDSRLNLAEQAHEAVRRKLLLILMICGIAGPLGALFIHVVLSGRLVQRVQTVEENARRLAHGLPLDPLPDGADEIAGLGRQIEDAAFLLRARERDLRDSETRYRELFDRAPIPYEETDNEGRVRRFNQAVVALLKSPPDRILGRRAWDYLAPDLQGAFRDALLERIASGTETGPYECEYFLEDGSRVAVEIREMMIRGANGEVTGVCRSVLDITERHLAVMATRKAEQYALELRNKNEQLARALDAARSATEAKSRFLAGVSHELRTPLNAIIGFSELMHDGRVGPISDDHRDFLSDILTSARHLLRLINDILDLSKIEAGRMEFRPEPRLLTGLVQEVCDVVRPLAEKKEIALVSTVPEDIEANLDPSRFKQVLYNFLSNAVKFTPRGGCVSVRVRLERDHCFRVEVEDTGVGIEAHEIPLLFREFQQLTGNRKAEQGTGLGLALTRTIVEAQGGQVGVQSTPGQGSVFSAVLPLEPQTSTPAPSAIAEVAR